MICCADFLKLALMFFAGNNRGLQNAVGIKPHSSWRWLPCRTGEKGPPTSNIRVIICGTAAPTPRSSG